MGVIEFWECGRKRKGEKATCHQCGKEFVRRLTSHHGISGKKQIYCSTDCAHRSREKKTPVACWNCKKTLFRSPSKLKVARHGIYFCSRECKEFAQSLQGDCAIIQPDHYGTGDGIHNYRDRVKNRLLQGCEACSAKLLFLLQVHHKDGSRRNNHQDNLEVVCNNCHAIRHLKRSGDDWKFDHKALTPRNELGNIQKLVLSGT